MARKLSQAEARWIDTAQERAKRRAWKLARKGIMPEDVFRVRVELSDEQELDFQAVLTDKLKGGDKNLTPERIFWGYLNADLYDKQPNAPSLMEQWKLLRRDGVLNIGEVAGSDRRIEKKELKILPHVDAPIQDEHGKGVYYVRLWEEILSDLSKVASMQFARLKAVGLNPKWVTVNDYVCTAINEGIDRDHIAIRKRDSGTRVDEFVADDKKVREEAEKLSKKSEEKKP